MRPRPRRPFVRLTTGMIMGLSLCVAACTQFPELDATVSPEAEAAPFPKLVPIAPLLAANAPVVADPQSATQSLSGRVARLQARAARLQARPVIDSSTKTRLRRAIATAPR